MVVTRGRVVQTPTKNKPYKVVLEQDGEANIEKPVTTMREGEALIKRGTPTPPERDTTHDHEASDA